MASNNNLRNHNTLGPPEPTIPCLEPSCNRHFYNRTGRSNHIRSKHPPDPQQRANDPTSSNPIPGQPSSDDDDLSSSSSGNTVSSNSRSRSRGSGDKNTDNLGGNLDVDILLDGGHEEDDRRSIGIQTRESSVARSIDPGQDPQVVRRIGKTHHPIINGQFSASVLAIIYIYSIFRDNL